MAKVTFKTDLCKGCGLCVSACPKHILAIAKDQINQKGGDDQPGRVHRLRLLRGHVPRLHHHRGEVRRKSWQREY